MNNTALPDVDDMLRDLVWNRWTLHYFGRNRNQPDAIAALKQFAHVADVVLFRGHDRAVAYRVPLLGNTDPLTTDHVVWHYLADPTDTLRAVLTLSPTADYGNPYPIPPECRIPESQHWHHIVRLP